MGASVWIKSSMANSSWIASMPPRPSADTMPDVTELRNRNGLPTTSTHSPTSSASESPSEATGSGSSPPTPTSSRRSTAMSVVRSWPTTSARYSRFSVGRYTTTRSPRDTTWALVST